MGESVNILLSSSFSDSRKGLLLWGREENSWKTKEERGIVRPTERHSYATTRTQARGPGGISIPTGKITLVRRYFTYEYSRGAT